MPVRNHVTVITSKESIVRGIEEVEEKAKAEVFTPTPAPLEAKKVVEENVIAKTEIKTTQK